MPIPVVERDEAAPVARPVPFIKTNASVLLDLVRGLAALLVLLEHWRNIFFVDYPQLVQHRALLTPFYLLCTAGHQAVVIFFVLSGYLISGSIFRMLHRGAWSWRAYLTHRLVRLWVVLIPGLILCALWDGLGLHLGLAPKLYGGLSGDHMIGDVATTYSLHLFTGNLVFLQGITMPTFGSDGALWSLANEFWYYLLFPLGLFAIHPKSPLSVRGICVVCLAAIAWFVGINVLKGFPIWLIGTALASLRLPKLRSGVRYLGAALYVPVFFLLGRKAPMRGWVADDLLGIATFGLMWILLSATAECRQSAAERFSRTLSRFSFTLYVGHTPLCVLLAALVVGADRWFPTAGHLACGLVILAVLLGYAYGLALVTEFQTDRVRRWLELRVFRINPS